MHWPRFAAVLSFSLIGLASTWSRAAVVIHMEDGSTLEFPDSFFHNATFAKKSLRHTVLTGKDKNHRAMIGFIARNPTPANYKIEDELRDLLKIDGLRKAPFENVRQDRPHPLLVEGAGPWQGQLLIFRIRRHINGVAVFFLIGPEPEFHTLSPDFQTMVERYRPGATPLEDPGQVEAWMVIAAILTLFFNVALVWFGIKLIARFKRVD